MTDRHIRSAGPCTRQSRGSRRRSCCSLLGQACGQRGIWSRTPRTLQCRRFGCRWRMCTMSEEEEDISVLLTFKHNKGGRKKGRKKERKKKTNKTNKSIKKHTCWAYSFLVTEKVQKPLLMQSGSVVGRALGAALGAPPLSSSLAAASQNALRVNQ